MSSSRDIPAEILSLQRVHARLQSTPTDQLPNILHMLLPRLLPLVNDEKLQPVVKEVVIESLRRIEICMQIVISNTNSQGNENIWNPFGTLILDLLPLIQSGEYLDSTQCAIDFVDTILLKNRNSNENDSILLLKEFNAEVDIKMKITNHLLTKSIAVLTPFSNQSNAVCNYILFFFEQINQCSSKLSLESVSNDLETARNIIGDFLLDICLLSNSIERGAVGSVQPGLSAERVDRLTCKQQRWTVQQVKELKEGIIQHILTEENSNNRFIPAKYLVAMAITLSQDADSHVSMQAVFKMNGALNLFKVLDPDINNPTDTLQFLLRLCSRSKKQNTITQLSARSPLRLEVQVAIIRWICKEMTSVIPSVAKDVVAIVVQMVFSPDASQHSSANIALMAAFAHLADTLIKNIDDSSFVDMSILILQCCKKLLVPFTVNSTSSTSQGSYNTEPYLALRCSCYSVIEVIGTRAASFAAKDMELVVLLFRLLSNEDERIISRLYVALNVLQIAHSNADVTKNVNNASLLELILLSRKSPDCKKRLAALQWAQVLFGWQSLVIETAILLSGDDNDSVRDAAHAVFLGVKSQLSLLGSEKLVKATAPLMLLKSLLMIVVENNDILSDALSQDTHRLVVAQLLLDTLSVGVKGLVTECVSAAAILNSKAVNSFNYFLSQKNDLFLPLVLYSKMAKSNAPNFCFLEEEFLDLLLTVINLLSKTSFESSAITASQNIDAYFQSDYRCVETSTTTVLKDVYWFRVDIVRLLASVTRNSLLTVLLAWTPASIVSRLQTLRMSLSSALLSWLQISEAAVKRDIAQSLSILCAVDIESSRDYLTHITRLLAHKAGFLSTETSRLETTRNGPERLNSVTVMQSGSLKCLQSVSITSILALLSQQYTTIGGDNEVARVYNSVLTNIKKSLSISAGSSRSDADTALMVTNALDCLDDITMSGCLVLSIKGSLTSSFEKERPSDNPMYIMFLSPANELSWIPNIVTVTDIVKERFGACLDCVDVENMISQLFAMIDACSDARICTRCIDSISRLAVLDANVASNVLGTLTSWLGKDVNCLRDVSTKFAFAEALLRLHLAISPFQSIEKSTYRMLLQQLVDTHSTLLPQLSTGTSASIQAGIDSMKGTLACVLLCMTVSLSSSDQGMFSMEEVKIALSVLLTLLREKDLFTQDICCMAICHLYFSAYELDSDSSVANYIASEVMTVLTREKKLPQPAGFAAAGSGSDNIVVNNAAQQPQPVLPAMNRNDRLALATAAAASELAGSVRDIAAANLQAAQDETATLGDYGIYGVVSKISRKISERSVLFGLLSLIRSDPSFGVGKTSSIFSRYKVADIKLDPKKLANIIPMLFAYRFEPNATVRELIRTLWEKLIPVADQKSVISANIHNILKHLCSKLDCAQWRDRESSCLALESIIPQRAWSTMLPFMNELWLNGLRVLDDLRLSTRDAALGYMKALSGLIVRYSNPAETDIRIVGEVVDFIVPLILDKGLAASSAEARGFSLGVLLKIVQVNVVPSATASTLFSQPSAVAPIKRHHVLLEVEPLDKWLPQLVSALVECMSALEPKILQYMQFHTTRMQLSDEELEQARIKMAQSSPLQEALTSCLQRLTPHVIPDVVRVLSQHLKGGVGLATRAAAAEAMSFLAERYPHDLGPYAKVCLDSVLSTLINALQMTSSLKKAMLAAMAALCKVVDEKTLEQHCDDLVYKYNNEQHSIDLSELSKVIAGCLDVLISRSGDRITDKHVWKRLLTCIYAGCFETDAESSKLWSKIWNESAVFTSGAGTKQAALSRILTDLIPIVQNYLQDLYWNRRLQGLSILRDVIATLDSKQFASQLSPILITALRSIPGQIWTGKGQLLVTIAEICARCEKNISFATDNDILLSVEGHASLVLRVSELQQIAVRERLTTVRTPDAINQQQTDALHDLYEAEVGVGLRSALPSTIAQHAHWEINVVTLCSILLRESHRGDKEYQFTAAKALTSLPWLLISHNCPVSFMTVCLPQLCERINIHIFPSPESKSFSSFLLQSELDVQPQTSTINQSHLLLPQSIAKPVVASKKMNTSSMFGVRYGPTGSTKMRRKDPVVTPISASSSTAADEQSSTAVICMPKDENALNNEMEVESTESKSTAPTAIDPVLTVVDEYSALMNRTDPAFRMMILECMYKGWPRDLSDLNDRTLSVELFPMQIVMNTVAELIAWMHYAVEKEMWSVKRVIMQLIGAIESCSGLNDYLNEESNQRDAVVKMYNTHRERSMKLLKKGMEEQKYFQIRVESLKSLERILKCKNCSIFSATDGIREDIRDMIRTASQDNQPNILEAATRLQDAWMQLR